MKNLKRFVAMLMLLAIVFTMVPVQAFATQDGTQSSMDMGDVSVQGTNGFGTLLSQEIDQSQAEADAEAEEYEPGYSVTDLVIEDRTAFVTYASMEDALLVVALYTEDGMQLLTSATTQVTAEDTEAVLEFGDDMPEYFEASAYLLDTYDYSPLCASYDTPMYTREMQELLESTVDDYDPELVLNLDDDKTTNFAVYADSTILIEGDSQTNIVSDIDEENRTYVIQNADEQITELQEGDVIVYPYASNEILIVKLDSIRIIGQNATIKGTEVDISEVFSHVKIESTGTTSDVTVDAPVEAASIADGSLTDIDFDKIDAVTYNGISDSMQPYAFEENIGGSQHHSFSVFKRFEDEAADSSVEIKGTLDLGFDIGFTFYISWARQYVTFTVDTAITFSIGVSGKIEASMPIRGLTYQPIPSVKIGFIPELKVEFSGELTLEATLKSTIGFGFSTDKGFVNLCTAPEWDTEIKIQGSFFIGLDLLPGIEILYGKLAEMKLSFPVGVVIEAELNKDKDTQEAMGIQHNCDLCIDGTIFFRSEFGVELVFLKCRWLTFEKKFTKTLMELSAFYYSADNDNFGLGTCPDCSYRTTIQVTSKSGAPIPSAQVTIEGYDTITMNKNGVQSVFLPGGEYRFTTTVNGEQCIRTCNIPEYNKITLFPVLANDMNDGTNTSNGLPGILGSVDAVDAADFGPIHSLGNCGVYGTYRDNVKWTLYRSGVLIIRGYGLMADYRRAGEAPWGSSITAVIIQDGVTSIGNSAFLDRSNLTSITIPNSVTSIGNHAFSGCSNLTSITIPNSVTSIGYFAFNDCDSLPSITMPNSVTSIQSHTFYDCDSLTSVTIPNSITSIGDSAFFSCDSLSSVTIPDSITSIGDSAFSNCSSLTSITIPDSVTTINHFTFSNCYSLSSITIPNSVIGIGGSAFSNCYSLTNVYYDGTEAEWNAIDIGRNNTGLENATIYFNSIGPAVVEQTAPPTVNAVYPGKYGTEEKENYILKTASFKDLVPAQQYVLLAMKSIEVDDPLAADNLLYVKQGAALEDGTLYFSYVQRETADISYVVACGASNKDLKDAEITFPEMTADGTLQVIDPTVVYDGETLTEGIDYTIVGTVDYTDGGTYTCSIRGIRNYTGLVECTYTVSGADVKPNAPTLKVSNVASSGKVKVTWNKVDGAAKYEVYRATSKSGTYKLQKTTTGTTYTNTTATAGKTYYYYVVAVAENGIKSDPSAIKSRTCDLPRPVVTLSNVASSGKIKISWDAVSGAVEYTVYRATSPDGEFKRLTTTKNSSVTNTSTTAGTTYYYTVVAVAEKSAANSAESQVQSLTCTLAQPTVTLSNVASTGKIKISWAKVDGAVKYEVWRATSKNGTYSRLTTTTATSVTNTKTEAGKTYYYKVKALAQDSEANSAYSTAVSRTCDLAQPVVTIALSSKKPKVSWKKIDGATKYEVYRATSKNGTYSKVKTTTSTAYKDTAAKSGKTYYYKVVAVCSKTAGNSAYSAVKSIKSK